jgi:hypothetical protein
VPDTNEGTKPFGDGNEDEGKEQEKEDDEEKEGQLKEGSMIRKETKERTIEADNEDGRGITTTKVDRRK